MRITSLDLKMIEMAVGRGCRVSVEWHGSGGLSITAEVNHNGDTHALQKMFDPGEMRLFKKPEEALARFSREAKANFDNRFREQS